MRLFSFFLFVVGLFTNTLAQNAYFKQYKNLTPKGPIPSVILQSFEERVEVAAKTEIKEHDKKKTQKGKKNFVVSSSYTINNFLQGGSLLFNDTLTQYVTNVARELLKDDVELFNKLNFFVVKSPYVNAFTTNDGYVFVNIGLLAQLETEAQLAYILSHEIIHYKNKHAIDIYLEKSNIYDYYKQDKFSESEALLKQSNFSKEKELEADEQGLDLFLSSNYSYKSLEHVFDVLQFSYLPIDEVPFDTLFFGSKNLKIPSSYYLKKLKEIELHDEANETHPNISVRREKILSRIKDMDATGKKEFFRTKEEFMFVRDVARFELSNLYLKKRKYASAIYNSYLMLKQYPNNYYLQQNIAEALYFLAKYGNAHQKSDVLAEYTEIEGEVQQVYHLFHALENDELNVLASEYLWNLYLKFPDQLVLKRRAQELLNELVFKHHHDRDFFSKTPYVAVEKKKEVIEVKEESAENKSKYDKIREKMSETKPISVDTTKMILRYAFVDLFANKEFQKGFDLAIDNYVNSSKQTVESNHIVYYKSDNLFATNKTVTNKVVKNLIVINPTYLKLKESSRGDFKFYHEESNLKEKMLNEEIVEMAKRAGTELIMVSPASFTAQSIDKYIELGRLDECFSEMRVHEELDSFVTLDPALAGYLEEKYNTTYFSWNLMIELQKQKSKRVLLYFIYPLTPLLPFVYLYTLVPSNYLFHKIVMADAKKGKVELDNFYTMKGINRRAKMKSNIYYNLSELRKEPVKKKVKE